MRKGFPLYQGTCRRSKQVRPLQQLPNRDASELPSDDVILLEGRQQQ